MDPIEDLDGARAEALIVRAADGDDRACMDVVVVLWPALQRMVRSDRSLGRLTRSEDHVEDVLTDLVAKLGAPGSRALRLYGPWRRRHPDKALADWLRIVTKNVVRDHVRQHLGARSGDAGGPPSLKRMLNEFDALSLEGVGARPPITAAQTARQLLEFARARLPADQLAALEQWVGGASFEEIQADLGLTDAVEARKKVRAACETLRRHFGDGGGGV